MGLCLGAIGLVWIRMIVSPAPQEMREGAMQWTTAIFLSGQNPYTIEAPTGAANVYGPLYPLLVAVAGHALGATLFAHRLVNAIGILVACGLLFRIVRRNGASLATALIGAGVNLAGLLYWVGPTARPDGVGMALSIAAYAVLAPAPANPRRFAGGLALSLLGFATKVYYVLPIFVAVAWLVWQRDYKRGLRAGLVALVALAGTTIALGHLFPTWAPVVLGANLRATTYDPIHLMRQTFDWALFSLPLLVALATSLRSARSDGARDIWPAALAVGAAVILVALGGHRGAHMTYLFHLISPALTVVALRGLETRPLSQLALAASLPFALIVNAHWFTTDFSRFERAEATFARLTLSIARADRPTGTGEFAPLLLAAGVTPIETGHTEYTRFHASSPLAVRLWGAAESLDAEARAQARRFYAGVHGGAFDLVLANRRRLDLLTPDLLWQQYRVAEELVLDMPWAQQTWPIDVWVPRTGRTLAALGDATASSAVTATARAGQALP